MVAAFVEQLVADAEYHIQLLNLQFYYLCQFIDGDKFGSVGTCKYEEGVSFSKNISVV